MADPGKRNPVVGLVHSIDDPGLLCMRVVPDYSDKELKAHPESIPTKYSNLDRLHLRRAEEAA